MPFQRLYSLYSLCTPGKKQSKQAGQYTHKDEVLEHSEQGYVRGGIFRRLTKTPAAAVEVHRFRSEALHSRMELHIP